ncbi:MAG: hypothetical protein IKN59_07295 [Paludibacteraceae bacterium]|nr:hypothetical protein [Paludibacteraceae bacterium]
MKKVFFAAAIVLCAILTSCDTKKAQCWEMSVTYDGGKTTTYYFWGTGDESDAQINVYAKIPGVTRASKTQALFVSESDCEKLNK